jgi:hypothetical protein
MPCNTNYTNLLLGILLDWYKNNNMQVSKQELQENSQPESTTLGGQNNVTTDSKYVEGGGGCPSNGQGGNKEDVRIDCMAKLARS